MPEGHMGELKSEKESSEIKLEEKWPQTVSTSHFVKGHSGSDI